MKAEGTKESVHIKQVKTRPYFEQNTKEIKQDT